MELLTTLQMAKLLGVSRSTIYNLIRDGKMAGYVSRVGRKYVTTPELMKKFIDDAILDEVL